MDIILFIIEPIEETAFWKEKQKEKNKGNTLPRPSDNHLSTGVLR